MNLGMRSLQYVAIFAFAASSLFGESLTFESGSSPASLIELYASEGCSSCPPADAWISRLKTNPDLWKRIVPVVFHVDYWNNLGWPDRFANAANTTRQRRYASVWGTNSVYTPGFVLNGREWRDWAQTRAPAEPSAVKAGKLTVTTNDASVQVVFAPEYSIPAPLRVEFALLGSDLESDVKRGENSGRKLRHDFTVLYFAVAPMRLENGRFMASLALPPKTTDTPAALAAWVTFGDAQPPLQATGGWLRSR